MWDNGIMSQAKKKLLSIDDKGRICLPKEIRENNTDYSVSKNKDGVIRLVPQVILSKKEVKELERVKDILLSLIHI